MANFRSLEPYRAICTSRSTQIRTIRATIKVESNLVSSNDALFEISRVIEFRMARLDFHSKVE